MLQRFQSFSSNLRYFQRLLQVCSLCDLFRVLLQVFLAWSALFIFSLIKHHAYQLLFSTLFWWDFLCFKELLILHGSSTFSRQWWDKSGNAPLGIPEEGVITGDWFTFLRGPTAQCFHFSLWLAGGNWFSALPKASGSGWRPWSSDFLGYVTGTETDTVRGRLEPNRTPPLLQPNSCAPLSICWSSIHAFACKKCYQSSKNFYNIIFIDTVKLLTKKAVAGCILTKSVVPYPH